MGHHRSWGSAGEQQPLAVAWCRVSFLGVCLALLVSACTPIPTPSAFTLTATEPALPATITAYHGQTGTIFAVAWSPDGAQIASGGADTIVHLWHASSC